MGTRAAGRPRSLGGGLWATHRVKFNVKELNLIPPLCSLSHTPQGEGEAYRYPKKLFPCPVRRNQHTVHTLTASHVTSVLTSPVGPRVCSCKGPVGSAPTQSRRAGESRLTPIFGPCRAAVTLCSATLSCSGGGNSAALQPGPPQLESGAMALSRLPGGLRKQAPPTRGNRSPLCTTFKDVSPGEGRGSVGNCKGFLHHRHGHGQF